MPTRAGQFNAYTSSSTASYGGPKPKKPKHVKVSTKTTPGPRGAEKMQPVETPPTGEEVKGALVTAIYAMDLLSPDEALILRKFYTAVYGEHIPPRVEEDDDEYDLDDDLYSLPKLSTTTIAPKNSNLLSYSLTDLSQEYNSLSQEYEQYHLTNPAD